MPPYSKKKMPKIEEGENQKKRGEGNREGSFNDLTPPPPDRAGYATQWLLIFCMFDQYSRKNRWGTVWPSLGLSYSY